MTEPSCPSCAVPFIDHLGLTGTCADLITERNRLAKLRKAIKVFSAGVDEMMSGPPHPIRGKVLASLLCDLEEAAKESAK